MILKSRVEDGIGAGLDQITTLVPCLTHVCGDRPVDSWNQSGDQASCFAGAAGTGRARGGMSEAVVDDRGKVVGVFEAAGLDEAWQNLVDVVMVVCLRSRHI